MGRATRVESMMYVDTEVLKEMESRVRRSEEGMEWEKGRGEAEIILPTTVLCTDRSSCSKTSPLSKS